ncbi:MAG: hypothetical protein ACRDGT_05105 [Candidatus Limnocylindria bacterium]
MIGDRDLAIATEHPRGTERRTLLPYREALLDTAAYARLAEGERDVIVRWAEIRRRIREGAGVDNDPANLADPLLPADRLRAHVIEGERIAGGAAGREDPGGDLIEAVRGIRGLQGRVGGGPQPPA